MRIDHFRGFEAYWEVPATEKTAVNGRWVKGPGEALFTALIDSLGPLPVIAEDLGVITPDVEALRDRFGFPGMKILQFAFGSGPENPYLPHNYVRETVVYTGTHDNDTTAGWYAGLSAKEKKQVRDYLGSDGKDIVGDLIRAGPGFRRQYGRHSITGHSQTGQFRPDECAGHTSRQLVMALSCG